MKKFFGAFTGLVFVFALAAAVGYSALVEYYQDNFVANTWVNGIYCTGKSVEEVNEELIMQHEASVIRIADADCTYWEINMAEAGITPDYTKQLKEFRKQTASGFRPESLLDGADIQLKNEKYIYSEWELKKYFYELPVVKQEITLEKRVYVGSVSETDPVSEDFRHEVFQGFYLYDGKIRRLNADKAFEALKKALDSGKTEVSLWEEGCYEDLPDEESDRAQRALWEKMRLFADRKLVYDMGAEQIAITPEIAFGFLEKDDAGIPQLTKRGSFVTDINAVYSWVDELAERYNTAGKERAFDSSRGERVMVNYVKYGTMLDVETEKDYLLSVFLQEREEIEYHVPSYIQKGFVRGLDDIGGTYVEIDLTNQKMYYYADHTLLLETEVVTGDMSKGWNTPAGVCSVKSKNRKVILRGPGYESFVEYWMPVWGGVGIHDASWRNKFGGEIYKKNGSHGCINTPPAIMDEFYEAISVGTPVIMYY